MVTYMAREKSQAAEIKRISGFGDEDAERLSKNDIKTVEALWVENRDDIAGRLGRTGQTSGVKLEILYAVLMADALGALSKKGWWRRPFAAANRHKGELTLFILLVLAVSLMVYRGVSTGQSFTPRLTVKVGSKLTPYRKIDPNDLSLEKAMPSKGTFSSVDQVAGRYPSEVVTGGKPVTEAQLLSKELSDEIGKRYILALPAEQGTAGREIKTPAAVWLLLPSPDEKAPAAVLVKDVLLLAVRRDGERVTATIAVTEQGLNEIKNCVGRTKAIVIQPAM
jgi:hypothetical protein